MREKILIVDDDPNIRKVLRFALEKAEFEVEEARDGIEALEKYTTVDFIVLDIMMPRMDGLDVCKKVRQHSSIPILFLSSQDDEFDRVRGLEIGGDDYLVKPFSPRELVARIKAILRRINPITPTGETDSTLSHGRLNLDLESFIASWDGNRVYLTKSEFEILHRFMLSPNKLLRRNELMRGQRVSDRTIDSHVGHLRKKFAELDAAPIETLHGLGYKLGSCE